MNTSKAEILAKASGVSLGDLISIEYNWGELHLYSQTSYALRENQITIDSLSSPDIVPDDIAVSDTVSFVWEINNLCDY